MDEVFQGKGQNSAKSAAVVVGGSCFGKGQNNTVEANSRPGAVVVGGKGNSFGKGQNSAVGTNSRPTMVAIWWKG